ncbi:MAG TPA: HAD family acid phosphatase [Mucilaginibacter sp.]|jgi:5'-nucleotidase (lipoprotein e(P4) family)|nr:HAD family acid phosphatase [Mucilaginibacter sp.]
MKKFIIYTSLILGSAACASFVTKNIMDKKNADEEGLLGILYQQNAAEYKALCFQAYNLARQTVDKAANTGKKNLAIVTDLDETALDNSEGEAFAYKNDRNFVNDLTTWNLFGQVKAVPGAVEFFQYAKGRGIDIYYISNRKNNTAIVEATRKNMHSLGFPYTNAGDHSHFLFQDSTRGALSTKEPRRKMVADVYKKQIIVLLGDNMIDINAAFDKKADGTYLSPQQRWDRVDNFKGLWGTKYIVFPNAYYGDWEQAYNTNGKTIAGRDSVRQGLLKVVDYTH